MLHVTLKVLADLGEGVNPVEGTAAIAEAVKCAPVKAAAWPFGPRERAAGVQWEEVAVLDVSADAEGAQEAPCDSDVDAAAGEGTSGAVAADGSVSDAASVEPAASRVRPQVGAAGESGAASEGASGPAARPLGLRATLLHQPLWEAGDAHADANWSEVFVPGVTRLLAQLQRDVARAGASQEWLAFSRIDVVCDRFTVGVPCEGGEFGHVVETLELVRQQLAAGAFGVDPVRIDQLPGGSWRIVAADGSVEVL